MLMYTPDGEDIFWEVHRGKHGGDIFAYINPDWDMGWKEAEALANSLLEMVKEIRGS